MVYADVTAKTVRKLIIIMAGIAALMVIGGAAFHIFHPPEPQPWSGLYFGLGVILSTAVNAVKFIWIYKSIKKITAMPDSNQARNQARLQYLLRYLMTFVVLIIAALVPFIDIIGAAIGLFTHHLSLVFLRIFAWDDIAGSSKKGDT